MNKDIFEGKLKQIRGEANAWWGKLTKNDLDCAAGKLDIFAGLLQERVWLHSPTYCKRNR